LSVVKPKCSFSKKTCKVSFTTSQKSSISSKSLKYDSYGNADRVLSIHEETLNKDQNNSVVVKMLAAPVNPGDFNVIRGVYGKPTEQFPAVAGMEGVGVVEDSGDSSLSPGDWVVPSRFNFGTWRTFAVCKPSDLIKIPKDIPASSAAVLSVNPSTAYRLLEDFSLKKGDVIIQNAANSMLGQSLIQLAKEKGVKTINVVRKREAKNLANLQSFLKSLGADEVIDEESLQLFKTRSSLESKYGSPTLAINATGGQAAVDIARYLKEEGTLVTVGGLSSKPVILPSGLLIFKDINCKGFWIDRWNEQHTVKEREEVLQKLASLVKAGKLKFNIEEIPFTKYADALNRASVSQKDSKVVFKF